MPNVKIIYQADQEVIGKHLKSKEWVMFSGKLTIYLKKPLILKKPSEWNSDLNMFKLTNELFNTEIKNLYDYIITYDSSNMF